MRKHIPVGALLAFVTLATIGCSGPEKKTASSSWNPKTAGTYLDYRASWWAGWNGAARDHGTFCISCHTSLPYALGRPVLRNALGETGPSNQERIIVEDVRKRVRLWKEIGPYYKDQGYDPKAAESLGTESVLNALVLSAFDSSQGELSNDTRAAFDNMWALQQTAGDGRGSWRWLQFDNEPWEANDSAYFGATLAAIAVGTAPGDYQATPEIENNLRLLRDYLNRGSSVQSLLNRVYLLWASTKMPGLLNQEQRNAIIKEALARQQSDGGWRLATVTWKWNGWNLKTLLKMWLREDGTPLGGKSDGVATGLITYVLEEAGVPRDDQQLERGLAWLASNQNTAEGFWPASSVNKKKNPTSDTGRFMSDAATAYAVLALTDGQQTGSSAAFIK